MRPSAEKGQADWQLKTLSPEPQESTRSSVAVSGQLPVDHLGSFCSGRCIAQEMTDSTWLLQQHSVCNQLTQLLSECVSSMTSIERPTHRLVPSNRIPVLPGSTIHSPTTAKAASGPARLRLEFDIETSGDPASVNDSEIRVPQSFCTMQERWMEVEFGHLF